MVAVVGLVGCTDPVDAFLDARDAFYAEACECVPVIVAVTDSSQECYDKKRVTSAGRECVHIAVGQSEAMENAYKCRGGAVEASPSRRRSSAKRPARTWRRSASARRPTISPASS